MPRPAPPRPLPPSLDSVRPPPRAVHPPPFPPSRPRALRSHLVLQAPSPARFAPENLLPRPCMLCPPQTACAHVSSRTVSARAAPPAVPPARLRSAPPLRPRAGSLSPRARRSAALPARAATTCRPPPLLPTPRPSTPARHQQQREQAERRQAEVRKEGGLGHPKFACDFQF